MKKKSGATVPTIEDKVVAWIDSIAEFRNNEMEDLRHPREIRGDVVHKSTLNDLINEGRYLSVSAKKLDANLESVGLSLEMIAAEIYALEFKMRMMHEISVPEKVSHNILDLVFNAVPR